MTDWDWGSSANEALSRAHGVMPTTGGTPGVFKSYADPMAGARR